MIYDGQYSPTDSMGSYYIQSSRIYLYIRTSVWQRICVVGVDREGKSDGAATPASNKKVPFFLAQMTVFALRTAIPHPLRKLSSSSLAVLVAGSAHLIVFHLIYRLNKIFSQSLCKTEYDNFKKKQSVHYDF
jgi:hypothetical protein